MSARNETARLYVETYVALVVGHPTPLEDIDARNPDITDAGITVGELVCAISGLPIDTDAGTVPGCRWDEAPAASAIALQLGIADTEVVWQMLDDNDAPELTHVYCEGCLQWHATHVAWDADEGPAPALCDDCAASGWTICECGEGLPPREQE